MTAPASLERSSQVREYWRRFWAKRSQSAQVDPPEALPEFYRREAEIVRLLTGMQMPRRVLELGCAGGELYEASGWSETAYTGVDFSASMLQRFRDRHPGARLILGDATTYVDDSQQFDLIFSNSVSHYFDRSMFRQHLKNARRMIAPTGVLMCGEVRWTALLLQRLIADVRYVRAHEPDAGLVSITRALYDELFRTTSFRVSELHVLAREAGFSCEVNGSLNAPGTLDVCMRPLVTPHTRDYAATASPSSTSRTRPSSPCAVNGF